MADYSGGNGGSYEDWFTALVCPSCGNTLKAESGSLVCEKCQSFHKVDEGIPYFIENEIYWSEPGIEKEMLGEIVEDMKNRNWRDVLGSHSSVAVRKHFDFIQDLGRANWHPMLHLDSRSVIMDFGAGMGTLSHAFSKHYKSVYAVEPVELRCKFMKYRFEQEGIRNVRVVRGDSTALPFQENSFDHILLNGVLEWLPYSYKGVNPREAQLRVLRNMNRLLNRNGSISIGVENRLNYGYFLGAPDSHLGIKYVTLLPRPIADVICLYMIGDRYRPYIYSWRGIRKLLRESGFKDIKIFNSIPSYNEPRITIELSSTGREYSEALWPTRNAISKVARGVLSCLGLLRYLGYAYRVVAKRE